MDSNRVVYKSSANSVAEQAELKRIWDKAQADIEAREGSQRWYRRLWRYVKAA